MGSATQLLVANDHTAGTASDINFKHKHACAENILKDGSSTKNTLIYPTGEIHEPHIKDFICFLFFFFLFKVN